MKKRMKLGILIFILLLSLCGCQATETMIPRPGVSSGDPGYTLPLAKEFVAAEVPEQAYPTYTKSYKWIMDQEEALVHDFMGNEKVTREVQASGPAYYGEGYLQEGSSLYDYNAILFSDGGAEFYDKTPKSRISGFRYTAKGSESALQSLYAAYSSIFWWNICKKLETQELNYATVEQVKEQAVAFVNGLDLGNFQLEYLGGYTAEALNRMNWLRGIYPPERYEYSKDVYFLIFALPTEIDPYTSRLYLTWDENGLSEAKLDGIYDTVQYSGEAYTPCTVEQAIAAVSELYINKKGYEVLSANFALNESAWQIDLRYTMEDDQGITWYRETFELVSAQTGQVFKDNSLANSSDTVQKEVYDRYLPDFPERYE